jgi:hypothetical protein
MRLTRPSVVVVAPHETFSLTADASIRSATIIEQQWVWEFKAVPNDTKMQKCVVVVVMLSYKFGDKIATSGREGQRPVGGLKSCKNKHLS